jgi:hypothetical protein
MERALPTCIAHFCPLLVSTHAPSHYRGNSSNNSCLVSLCVFSCVSHCSKFVYTGMYLVNPFRATIFGQSLLVRMQPELMSGLEVYKTVWHTVKRFLRVRLCLQMCMLSAAFVTLPSALHV